MALIPGSRCFSWLHKGSARTLNSTSPCVRQSPLRIGWASSLSRECNKVYMIGWMSGTASEHFGKKRIVCWLRREGFAPAILFESRLRRGELYCVGSHKNYEPQNVLQPWIFFGYFLCFKTKKVTLLSGLNQELEPKCHQSVRLSVPAQAFSFFVMIFKL